MCVMKITQCVSAIADECSESYLSLCAHTLPNTKQVGCHHKQHAGENIFIRAKVLMQNAVYCSIRVHVLMAIIRKCTGETDSLGPIKFHKKIKIYVQTSNTL